MAFDPKIVEAQLALNWIRLDEMPRIAWDALEAGLDGPAIRRLAALDSPTWSEVRSILPSAMKELGLKDLGVGEAAALFAKRRAQEILQSGADPLRFVNEFFQLWARSNYPNEIVRFGTLADDVYVAQRMGKSEKQIREWLIEELRNLIAA